jgi:predicted nucleic acid-binding protein
MILLDTNILSALIKFEPERLVVNWLDRQPAESVWTTSITVFESRFGLALLPRGRRRSALETAFERLIEDDLEDRVLAFDAAAAGKAATLAAEQRQAGGTVDLRDTQIAGIALSRRATIATRNVRHFDNLSVPVINPWDSDQHADKAET